ncbi:methyltransferase domain-containing protein [Polynucleobacter sp. AP-Jannik-300A-C4]|uniref:class I SAM-dependent methyltransferase n=1 Tax=Polynucleobacter sp. AP-Jannik-300A-C4 TaxID=2576928 RepID=UPI001BFD13BE|nr:methyltransferase domain-containing protein [Polynucleobacter sp. AP-Jannik-300A-C4]QWE23051.1 methyltransferase domain-containing protein [Polynucleobacter sp. AP-Jannik-300A-C4]
MKLHIGGLQAKDGWKILNVQKFTNVDYLGDISDLEQFEDCQFDEIYASHVLEHVPQKKMLATFQGIFRVLSPGGLFYISVPDLDILCRTFIDPKLNPNQKMLTMRMMFGGQMDEHDFHYFGWNQQFMIDFLRDVGFTHAQKVESFDLFEDTSNYMPFGFPVSLNIIARK